MSEQHRIYQVTIPAGTVAATPFVQDISFPPMAVESISWRMPNGHAGLVGWALTDGGSNILPVTPGQWIVASEGAESIKTTNYPDGGGWQVTGYNLGNYAHTIYVTFHLNVVRHARQPVQLIPDRLLVSAPDLSNAGPPIRSN